CSTQSAARLAIPRCAHSRVSHHSTRALPESCRPIRTPPASLSHHRCTPARRNRLAHRQRAFLRQDSETPPQDSLPQVIARASAPLPSLAKRQAAASPRPQPSPPARALPRVSRSECVPRLSPADTRAPSLRLPFRPESRLFASSSIFSAVNLRAPPDHTRWRSFLLSAAWPSRGPLWYLQKLPT